MVKLAIALISCAVLAGCATTYEIPTQYGIAKVKTYRQITSVSATIDESGIIVEMEGVTDPLNTILKQVQVIPVND